MESSEFGGSTCHTGYSAINYQVETEKAVSYK